MTTSSILNGITKSSLKFLEPLTPGDTYAVIVDEAVSLVEAVYGTIILEENGELKRVYSSHQTGYVTQHRSRGNVYRVFKQQKTQIVSAKSIAKAHPEIKPHGIKWTIFIPLSYRNKSIGVLTINSAKDRTFNKGELNALKLFGSLATLAIRKAQLYDETRKALEQRDLFLAMAAHELKTPITTIHGYAQLIAQKVKNKERVDINWIEDLSAESMRLILLVRELLEVNRIRTGQLDYNWNECDLKEIINRAILNFKFIHPQHEVEFIDRIDSLPHKVIGDFDKLLQMIINSLDNAAKYSSNDKKIQIVLELRNKHVVIKIVDQGKGIKKSDLEQVFDQFYRSNDSAEGMGLGLYLVKTIITAHRGDIKIDSKPGKGTTLRVQLPLISI